MKIAKHTLPLIFLFVALTACNKSIFGSIKGKGPNVTEIRSITGFNKIRLDIDADITYIQDSNYFVEISAQENVLNVLTTKVSAGELNVEFSKWVRRHSNISIVIHSPEIKGLNISGSGNITANGPINTNYMDLHISGSGNINLGTLNSDELEASISGSGNIQVNGGTANNQRATISGSGSMDMLGLSATNSNAKISGSGSITVKVIQQLDATISGSGNIRYAGTPIVNTHISGSGSVIHL